MSNPLKRIRRKYNKIRIVILIIYINNSLLNDQLRNSRQIQRKWGRQYITKSVEPANKESEKTNQNSPLQAAIYEIIIFPAIWLILAIYWQIINLYFIDFSAFLWHNFNIYRHEFQNSILFHDYVLLFSNLICSNKYGQKTDKY